jgi:hypothetical protein
MVTLARDEALELKLLEAVIAEERDRPRTQQRQIGPSEVGGCLELVRAKVFEPPEDDAPEEHWPIAANIGTVMGDFLEDVFGRRLNAVTQQQISAELAELGVTIAGHADVIFIEDNTIIDLKSTAAMGGVFYEGPKLAYYIQIALYVWGAVQAGILTEGAEGRIVYYDRTGDYQEFVAIVVTWDAILNFIDLGQQRIQQVMTAQETYEQSGDMTLIHALREYSPSYCFSTKVECPRRFKCWGGSDWAPVTELTDPNHEAAAMRYIEGRRLAQMGEAMKKESKEELKDVEGIFQNGVMVGRDKRGFISVVETKNVTATSPGKKEK